MCASSPVYADSIGLIFRGVTKIIAAPFQIPKKMMEHSSRSGILFPVGMATGAVAGSVSALTGSLSGAVDAARGAAPYAKYAVLFI